MFFYLHCGRGFNCLYGGRTNRYLTRWSLYGNLQNSFDQHKAPRHAWHIWVSPFASCPSLNTRDIAVLCYCGQVSAYCDVSSLPVLLEAEAGLPTGMDCRGSCPGHASISLIRVSQKSLCEIFFPRMKVKECNCRQWSGPAGGKELFLPTCMFDGWPCSSWPSYLYGQRTPCDGYNPPQLLSLSHSRVRRNNCLLWVDREYLIGGVVSPVLPHYSW